MPIKEFQILNLFPSLFIQGADEDVFPVEFDLSFGEKTFSYKAVNYEEKKRFLTALISLSDRTQMTGVRKISLNNLPPDLVLDESSLKSKVDQESTNKVSPSRSNYFPLSPPLHTMGLKIFGP